jgi:hypothetical protein
VQSGLSGHEMSMHFFHARQDRYRFDKECIRTCHAELVFLHPMGSAGHVVHSGESGRNLRSKGFKFKFHSFWIILLTPNCHL